MTSRAKVSVGVCTFFLIPLNLIKYVRKYKSSLSNVSKDHQSEIYILVLSIGFTTFICMMLQDFPRLSFGSFQIGTIMD